MKEKIPDDQKQQWQKSFSENPDMFGADPSEPARKAIGLYTGEGVKKILELGCGQGRDTIYFARNGFQVCALDYSTQGLNAVHTKADAAGVSHLITTKVHDVRNPLPFANETFDACFSHMLFCMAISTKEIEFLMQEIRRVLKPGGLNIYTVRHTGDEHYRKGIHRGEDMYEMNGFVVHFFGREKVEYLAKGYEILGIDEFEEGELPRRLFMVILRKKEG